MNSRKRHESVTLTNPLFAQTLGVLGRYPTRGSESGRVFHSNGVEAPHTATWEVQPQIRALLPQRSRQRSANRC